MNVPKTMKVARLYPPRDIRIETMDVPIPNSREALIKVHACGISNPLQNKINTPDVPGHELSGELVTLGHEVRSYKVGQRVFVHHHAPCFLCPRCRRGDYVHCDTWRSSAIHPGGVAEYVLVPEVNLEYDTLELPEGLTYEDGAMVEPLACVVKGLKRARVMKGDTVLVMGSNFMGMLCLQGLKKFGADRVIVAAHNKWQLDKAMTLGADEVINLSDTGIASELNNLTKGDGANIVILCSAEISDIKQAIKLTAPGGNVLMLNPPENHTPLTLGVNLIYDREISLIPSFSSSPTDTADAMDILKSGRIKAADLVTHKFDIDNTAEAVRVMTEDDDSLKCMIVFK